MERINPIKLIKEKRNRFFVTCFVILIAACIGIISIFFFGEDNSIEEYSEHIIKSFSGIDMDLSYQSEEENSNLDKNIKTLLLREDLQTILK